MSSTVRPNKRGKAGGHPARTAHRNNQVRGAAPSVDDVLLSACLIVKDEEKALPSCLASLRNLVDEVVVYDTGSTDATTDIASQAGARVIEGYWDDDFGRARNACLEQCHGEWVLWIDADEQFSCEHVGQLRAKLRELGPSRTPLRLFDGPGILDALAVDIFNLSDDGPRQGNTHRALRIFRRATCRWFGSLHEQIDTRPEIGRKIQVSPLVGAHIDHSGYMAEVMRDRGKLERNLRLAQAELASGLVKADQQGVPHLNVGRALSACGRFAEAQPYFDEAVSRCVPGVPTRTALLFSIQNLIALDRFAEAADQAQRFRQACAKKGLADYLEGVAQRRLGHPELAVALLGRVDEMNNEDGFNFVDTMLRGELAGALLECGRPAEAADQLIMLLNDSADITHMTAALRVVTATGRPIEDLAAAVPEDRLEKMAAALILVPPTTADPMAEALFNRFGPRPEILAAAIRFGPMVAAHRALEWSARLRAAGMSDACPLLAQAAIQVLEPVERLRAAVTAHAAFGDERARQLALAVVAGVSEENLGTVLAEVSVLDPPLLDDLASAASGPGAAGARSTGTASQRQRCVAEAMGRLAHRAAPARA